MQFARFIMAGPTSKSCSALGRVSGFLSRAFFRKSLNSCDLGGTKIALMKKRNKARGSGRKVMKGQSRHKISEHFSMCTVGTCGSSLCTAALTQRELSTGMMSQLHTRNFLSAPDNFTSNRMSQPLWLIKSGGEVRFWHMLFFCLG